MKLQFPIALAIVTLALSLVFNTTPTNAQGAATSKADLFQVARSGVSGVAVLEQVGSQVVVTVALIGGSGGSSFTGEIRSGSCDRPGEIVFRLGAISLTSDGAFRMTTTISTPFLSLLDGDHLVLIHKAGGTIVACGNLPNTRPRPPVPAGLPRTGGVPLLFLLTLAGLAFGLGICIRRGNRCG
ncbi:MAG: hypothetical protein ACRDIY_23445 [Chloroflexota bacterium]